MACWHQKFLQQQKQVYLQWDVKKSVGWSLTTITSGSFVCTCIKTFPWNINWPYGPMDIVFWLNMQCLMVQIFWFSEKNSKFKFSLNKSCPLLDFKHWKDKFLIEICSLEVLAHSMFLFIGKFAHGNLSKSKSITWTLPSLDKRRSFSQFITFSKTSPWNGL